MSAILDQALYSACKSISSSTQCLLNTVVVIQYRAQYRFCNPMSSSIQCLQLYIVLDIVFVNVEQSQYSVCNPISSSVKCLQFYNNFNSGFNSISSPIQCWQDYIGAQNSVYNSISSSIQFAVVHQSQYSGWNSWNIKFDTLFAILYQAG